MHDVVPFALVVAVASLALLAAVGSSRVSEWVRIPTPAIFLVAASVCADLFPALGSLSIRADQRIVTVALVLILFDGGMHIGLSRFRPVAGAIVWTGVAGTFVTAGALALLAHGVFGFEWQAALLLGAALAPTDPAVVFSVLGRREVVGRSGTLLEGESGANDPVGIALMISLLAATGGSAGTPSDTGLGGVPPADGARRRVRARRRSRAAVVAAAPPAPQRGAVPAADGRLRASWCTASRRSRTGRASWRSSSPGSWSATRGRRTSGRSSGSRPPPGASARSSPSPCSACPSRSRRPSDSGRGWTGIALAALLILVVRPVCVGLLILPIRLRRGERAFVLWAGLKGAVPILLGTYVVAEGVNHADRIYGVIFDVVLVSVVVQGGLVPTFARWWHVRMRVVEPEPWALGMRFRDEPEGLHRFVVAGGSTADGSTIEDLPLEEDVWISMVSRDGRLVQVRGTTVLAAGDEVLALASDGSVIARLFTQT